MEKVKISVCTPSIRPKGLVSVQQSLEAQTFDSFEWLVEIGIPGRAHDLNAAYNRMLRRAKGDLIVSLQDYTQAPPEYLSNFWEAAQNAPRTLFTAPVGKVDDLNDFVAARWDWRAYEDAKPKWDCWEIDSACAPRSMFFEVGGFDEVLDEWWSFDNVSVAKRADMLGYTFGNLFTNPIIVLDHDKKEPHPFRDRFRPLKVQMRMDSYAENPKLDYL